MEMIIMKKQALFKLTVLHTNDIHGNIDSLPQYSTVVNEIRKKEKNVLLLDSGDIFLRGCLLYTSPSPRD